MNNHLECANSYISNINEFNRREGHFCKKINPGNAIRLPDGHYGVHVDLADPSKELVISTARRLMEGALVMDGKISDTDAADRVFDVVGMNGQVLAGLVFMVVF